VGVLSTVMAYAKVQESNASLGVDFYSQSTLVIGYKPTLEKVSLIRRSLP